MQELFFFEFMRYDDAILRKGVEVSIYGRRPESIIGAELLMPARVSLSIQSGAMMVNSPAMSPDQARNLAAFLLSAASHAESRGGEK